MSTTSFFIPIPVQSGLVTPISIVAADATATTYAYTCAPAASSIAACNFAVAQLTVGPWASDGQGSGVFDANWVISDPASLPDGVVQPGSLHCTISSGQVLPCTEGFVGNSGTSFAPVGQLSTLTSVAVEITAGANLLAAVTASASASDSGSAQTSSSSSSSSAASAASTASTSTGSASATSSSAAATSTNAAAGKGLTLSAVGILSVFAVMLSL